VKVKNLENGDSFNELAFFSNIVDDFSVRAVDYVTVYKLKREDFYYIIKENKSDLEIFNMFKDDFIFKGY